ncbi:MAG: 6-phosphofructokinase [Christensenellaceae bacterium]|jgi:phosphofructokinase-like protein
MTKRIGILTSGGDCPGLNAVIRGVAKAAYERIEGVEIIGIAAGYAGLINSDYRIMQSGDFSGILTLGGTILGSGARTPFKDMCKTEKDNTTKVEKMVQNYHDMKLDCLCTLGGGGTHKTAHLLCEAGLNVIGLPKTIDNDIWGTDVTFGFHTAMDIATDVIDRVHTTAASHGRVMVVELMGNKAGWLTLYAGIAGGADVILIPEIPYKLEKVVSAVKKRAENGKDFSIVAVAEGAIREDEIGLKKKALKEKRMKEGFMSIAYRLAKMIETEAGTETRVVVPGHIQRGGSPNAYDRVLSTQFGVHAAELIYQNKFGYTVASVNNQITENPLSKIAGKAKLVPPDSQMVRVAEEMGISMGI